MYLLTLTAPGERPHQRKRFSGGGSGVCGCELALTSLAEWNPTASARWNRLRTRVRQLHPGVEYLRTVETQKRGALHLHVIVWSPDGPLDPAQLQALALGVGFGCQLDLAPIEPGSTRHAYYVGKYVVKAAQERPEVPWEDGRLMVHLDTGEIVGPAPANYRTWSQSRGYGVTMRFLRAEARRHREQAQARERETLADLERMGNGHVDLAAAGIGYAPTETGPPG